jgi:hypothetical protein
VASEKAFSFVCHKTAHRVTKGTGRYEWHKQFCDCTRQDYAQEESNAK